MGYGGVPEEFFTTINFDDLGIDKKLSRSEKTELLESIGDYVTVAMFDMIGEGKSPVTGKQWKAKKDGEMSVLELEGDLLDALEAKVEKGELLIGFFDEKESAKAFGHTTGMEGHPWLEGKVPKRKIIPLDGEGEKFTKEIRQGIRKVIEDFLDETES